MRTVKGLVKENVISLIAPHILVNGKMERSMDRVYSILETKQDMKVNGKMTLNMVKECLLYPTVTKLILLGKMTEFMEKEF